MSNLTPSVDPGDLQEFSVVFTDRSLNHMSKTFQKVMNDISDSLKKVYKANSVIVVPGGGTYAMEAVARQFATNKKCLILRNGWFSYRWTQIFEMGQIPFESKVLKARRAELDAAFSPPPIEEVIDTILSHKPDIVFAAHVETASGIILPDEYLAAVADAVHSVGGLFVLDCIASGAIWVDMEANGVDILISAPQKGWSGTPCCGLVMLNTAAREKIETTTSTSFSCDLLKWMQIMSAYESGGHAYHATMPTDSLLIFRDMIKETVAFGLEKAKKKQYLLGKKIRDLLVEKGASSVAGKGFQAPGVVVCYTDDPNMHNGKKFRDSGLQIAAGVPLQCDEPEDFMTFRIGLFGLDKLKNVDATVERFSNALEKIFN